MAVIKQGATGKSVTEIQTLLNKAGARPKLDEDGIFGPLTEAALKTFQKKAKVTASGKVDSKTMSCLKYGGPLPEMTVTDYATRTTGLKEAWAGHNEYIKGLKSIQSQISTLDDIWSKDITEVNTLFKENYKHWEKVAELCEKLVKKQKEFGTELLKDPKKAAGIVTECEAMHAQVSAIATTKVNPNFDKRTKLVKAARKKLDTALKAIQADFDNLAK